MYRAALSYAVGIRGFWEAVADFGSVTFDAIATLQAAKGREDRLSRESLTADLGLVRAPDEVAEAFARFCGAADQCRLGFIDEMQKAGVSTAADAKRQAVHVGQARSTVNSGLGALRDRYEKMRDLMRDDVYPEEGPPPRLRDLFGRRDGRRNPSLGLSRCVNLNLYPTL